MGEGTVFSLFVSSHLDGGGGTPVPGLSGGVPHPRSGWGVPHPRSGGGVPCPRSGEDTPSQVWGHTPILGLDGEGVPPGQVWMVGYPVAPSARSGQWGYLGYPIGQVWMVGVPGPPPPSQVWMGGTQRTPPHHPDLARGAPSPPTPPTH